MAYTVTITLPSGPTTMKADQVPVIIRRHCNTPEQLRAIQSAADVLQATDVQAKREGAR